MTIILGIDPGSRITGYGVIQVMGDERHYVASGCVRTKAVSMMERLQQIFTSVRELMQQYQPQEIALEQVFMHRNPASAIKLGQARGVAIAAVIECNLIYEYSPRQIKQAVVGYGAGEKEQVQQMVKRLLKLSGVPQADAADALAVALCHAQTRRFQLATQRRT